MLNFKMIGYDLYDYRSQKLATIKGADIYNTRSQKICTTRDNEAYDDRYQKILMVRGDDVYDTHNVRLVSLNEIKRELDNAPGGILTAALWWFFIKQ